MDDLADRFEVKRFIGRGCYSLVYEARCIKGADTNTRYALKRFFLQNSSAVNCAVREKKILEKLALEDTQSPFLPTLFYSYTIHGQPIFILREGNGCDLFDLLRCNGLFNESQARFYSSELISGLEFLHSMEIVHLDLKPENILLSNSGHIFISDFDRSYDLSLRKKKPTDEDFSGTLLFMAPEIAQGSIITTKADIWSLAVIIAEMVSGPIRPIARSVAEELRWAKEGRYSIKTIKTFTKPLQALFHACFQKKHDQRPNLSVVKKLRFYKHIDWVKVNNCSITPPPFPINLSHSSISEAICKLNPCDPDLLLAAYGKEMPIVKKRLCQILRKQDDQTAGLLTEVPDWKELSNAGISPEVMHELFEDFNFVNPVVRACNLDENDTEVNLSSNSCSIATLSISEDNQPEFKPEVENHSASERNRSRNRNCSAGD